MKKLLLLAVLLVSAVHVNAQCTPDPQFTSPGIYPDSATNLMPAFVGSSYSQTITAVTPLDTVVEIIPGIPQTVPIDSIIIDNISGLPPGFTYECANPSCVFYGGTSSCARIYSTTNPTIADTGRYYLTIDLTAYSIISQSSTLTYYYIDVIDSASVGINSIEGDRLEVSQNHPNPVDGVTYIDFNSGVNTTVEFTVMNLLGKVIHRQSIKAIRGENRITFDAKHLDGGIYLYTLDNGNVSYGNKMIVR